MIKERTNYLSNLLRDCNLRDLFDIEEITYLACRPIDILLPLILDLNNLSDRVQKQRQIREHNQYIDGLTPK